MLCFEIAIVIFPTAISEHYRILRTLKFKKRQVLKILCFGAPRIRTFSVWFTSSFFFVLFFLLCCLNFYQISSYGFYSISTSSGENLINFRLDVPSTIIIRYQLQSHPFLEALIKSVDDDKYSKVTLNPTQAAAITAKDVQIHLKEFESTLPPFLDIWVLKKEICPNIIFELPESSGYSLNLHSNLINQSICLFTPKYEGNFTQKFMYGIHSDNYSQILLFSNSKITFQKPLAICRDFFCFSNVDIPSFFSLRPISSKSFLLQMSLPGELKSEPLGTPLPIPLYDFYGKYTFGDEFDVKEFRELKQQNQKKRLICILTMILGSIFMLLVILLKVLSKVLICKINKDRNKNQVAQPKRPSTFVLNRYCPKTSALLISVM